jgi:hypothetical protein
MAFTLQPEQWYGWQMIPGYADDRCVPYFSPIRVHTVAQAPRSRIVTVEYTNVLYAAGVQEFRQTLSLLRRSHDYLVAAIYDEHGKPSDRVAVISHIEFEWLRRFCSELCRARPPELLGPADQQSPSRYLDAIFGVRRP